METYHVRAKRWEHGWELHIEGVGVTQSCMLWDAEDMARDLISRREDLPGDAFTVTVTLEIGDTIDEESHAAREAVSVADQAQRQATARARATARQHAGPDVISPRCSTYHLSAPASFCGPAPEDWDPANAYWACVLGVPAALILRSCPPGVQCFRQLLSIISGNEYGENIR